MSEILEKHYKIIYVLLAILCGIISYVSKQYYLFIACPLLLGMAFGILKQKTEEEIIKLKYDELLTLFEKGEAVDNTTFYFYDDEKRRIHIIGYTPPFGNPYWARYFDDEEKYSFATAKELFTSPIFDGESIKSRYSEFVILTVGTVPIKEWKTNKNH